MATPDPEYCREKARQNAYLMDIKKGFREVLKKAEDKHKDIKIVPKIKIMNVLVKLLSL